MQNTKKLLFTAILALSGFIASNSNCAAGPGLLRVSILTLDGREFLINLNATDTIADLKEKIYEREGIPVYQQRLMYAGKQLNDIDFVPKTYKPNRHITLVLRIPTEQEQQQQPCPTAKQDAPPPHFWGEPVPREGRQEGWGEWGSGGFWGERK